MKITIINLVLALALLIGSAKANDDIFPPADSAKAYIDFDGKGFIVNGERTFLASGSLHYPRAPRAQWRDILLRFKREGFTTVQTYAFWNYHEPKEGQWDFSGEKDFDAFLKLCKEVGLYVTVRVGPYVCAEWDSGGYPVWLRFKGIKAVRTSDPAFLEATDKWYKQIFKIVSANQINRGGSVILVQLENEHPNGWGTDLPNDYFKHLQTLALSLGLEVPYFFSGLHHASDPSPKEPIDSSTRKSPWYSTEFWSIWYNNYGATSPNDLIKYDRANWRILANGGNGYNYYMLFGGTDFGFTNDDEMASSYDYGAAVGQGLDLRGLYYKFKRAAWFGQSFASVVENSDNASSDYAGAADTATFKISARRSPAGTIVFLDNKTKSDVKTQLNLPADHHFPDQPITIPAMQFAPFVFDYNLTPGVKISASTPIYGISKNKSDTTVVEYGIPGEICQASFKVDGSVNIVSGSLSVQPDGTVSYNAKVPADGADESVFETKAGRIRVLAVSAAMADRTWFVSCEGTNYVVGGPDYVGDVTSKDGALQIQIEKYIQSPIPRVNKFFVSTPSGLRPLNDDNSLSDDNRAAPDLGSWSFVNADQEASPTYDDSAWLTSETPPEMGADGDSSAYAWYRVKISIAKSGPYTLRFGDIGDWARLFIDGQPSEESKIKSHSEGNPFETEVNLSAGEHTIAVLTAHFGRDKFYPYLGDIDVRSKKGIVGAMTLYLATPDLAPINITKWKWKHSPGGEETAPLATAESQDGWQDVAVGTDPFAGKPGYGWFEADLPPGNPGHRLLHFAPFFDNGWVYLGGTKVGEKHGLNVPLELALDNGWKSGTNKLFILVRSDGKRGDVARAASIQLFPPADSTVKCTFKMRGGMGNYAQSNGTIFDPQKDTVAGVPRLYSSNFTYDMASCEPGFVYRLSLKGLSRGFIFLNDHNLGRYPEKIGVDGIYLPECWMINGANKVQIYDEEGNSPVSTKIWVERSASGRIGILSCPNN